MAKRAKILIGILVVGIIAAGGWWVWEKIEDETVNWKIYKNGEYGFEIKYPEDWQLQVADWLSETSRTKSDIRFYPSWVTLYDINTKDLFVGINVVENTQGKSIPVALFAEPMTCENVVINDVEFCKLIIHTEEPFADITVYAVSKNNVIYSIAMSCDLPECETTLEFKIFNQMLSTFRFTD